MAFDRSPREADPEPDRGPEFRGPENTRDQCYTDPVANLTVTIDGDLLKRARLRAVQEGTSVNAQVRHFLTHYAGVSPASTGMDAFLDGARRSAASSGPDGRNWQREELYQRG